MRRVEMTTDVDDIVFEKFPFESKPCDPAINFKQDQTQEFFSKNMTLFTCLDNSDVFFRGTTVSKKTSYLHMELNKCEEELLRKNPGYENATCASDKELDFFFMTHMFVGYMTNTYVNKTTFDGNPISTLNDVIFYEQLYNDFDKRVIKEVQLNYNEVELKDSYFLVSDAMQQETHNFLSVDRVIDRNWATINPTSYFQVQFRLSNRVIEYERVIYNFFDMAGDVGGFGEFLHITFYIIVGSYANRMFYASVIRDMFRVRLGTGKANIDELVRRAKTADQIKAKRRKAKGEGGDLLSMCT